MRVFDDGPEVDRSRLAWWLFVLALGAAFLFVLYSFVGTFVLGVFGYYALRPAYRRLQSHLQSDTLAAGVAVLGVIVPVLALVVYAGFAVFQELLRVTDPTVARQVVNGVSGTGPVPDAGWNLFTSLATEPTRALLQNGSTIQTLLTSSVRVLSAITTGLLHLGLALTLSFSLLHTDDRLAALYERVVGGTDTAAYGYATAVDRDLEIIFYGNLLFVLVVAVLAAVVYHGANVVAPPGLQIPIPLVLAALTGVTALIPLIVSKVVYVPLSAYLGYQAMQSDPASLVFPIGLLVVSLVVLDLAPQMLIQPYITGRRITMALMLFAYLLGPLLFGWYGFFLLPLLLVLGLQAVRIALVELAHGEPVSPRVEAVPSLGSDPDTGEAAESGEG